MTGQDTSSPATPPAVSDVCIMDGVEEDSMEAGGPRTTMDDIGPEDFPHVIGINDDHPYGCSFCEKAFGALSHLRRHEEAHMDPMPFKCSYCSRQFRHRKSCERHEKLHSADRKYRCKICGVGYSRSDHLRNHMKTHDLAERDDNRGDHQQNSMKSSDGSEREDSSNTFKCPVCSINFTSSLTLSNHLKKHNEGQTSDSSGQPSLQQITCVECHQVFSSDQEMEQHVCPSLADEENDQSSVLELKCPVCSEKFSSMELLCHHLLCHRSLNLDTNTKSTSDRPTAGFDVEETNKENRGTVPETQTGGSTTPLSGGSGTNSPLVCPYCLIEGFESLESLELHLTSVHNVKATEVYTCNYCNAPYPNLYSLHDHMTVVHRSQHGLDITYPCSMCVQRFHSLDALAKHKGIVHAQQPSSGIDAAFCNRCNMTLSSPQSLEDHMATVHNIIMEKRFNKTKGRKSASKNSKGAANLHKAASTSSSKTANNSSPKKQSPSSASSLSPSLSKIQSSSSSSSSMVTSPAVQNSSITSPSFALAYAMSEAAQASSALRISALLAKKASILSSTAEQSQESLESSGLTCDHCNATFHDIHNFSTHLLLHMPSLMTSVAAVADSTPVAPRDGRQTALAVSPRNRSKNSSTSAEISESRNKTHECFQCKASFPSSDQLETHVLLHYLRVSTEYGCSSCSKNFSKPDELQRHLMDIHAHHLYRCSLCKEIFDSKVNIQVHFAIKHSDECKLYRCEACELNFRSEMEWQVHVRVNHLHISRPYRCLFCQESFTSEVELQCHLTTHSKPFVCPMCSQAFHIEYLLDQHMQQNHGDVKPDFALQQRPNSSSPTPLSLFIPTTIKQEHEEDQNYYASPSPSPLPSSHNGNISSVSSSKTILKPPKTCGNMSRNSPAAKSNSTSASPQMEGSTNGARAIPAVWKNSEPLHVCNICDIKFNDFSLLMMHKAQDHDLKNMGKASNKAKDEEDTNRSNLAENILLNSESLLSTLTKQASFGSSQNGQAASSLSCMFCSQTFKNHLDYEKHMKIHVNSGNLTCSICDETFSSPGVLAEHKLMHCKIQQGNTCVVCRVTLCNRDQFYSHSQEHGFEGTQLQCVVCRQSLSSLVELQMHGRHHFQPKTSFFTCCVCLKSFESRENLVSKLNSSGRTYYVCKPCYHGEAPPLHTCSQCSEKFATAQLLDVHMLTHKASFQCIKCQQSFSSEYEIQLHVATHLMTEGTQHECRLCGTSCDTPARLQTHLIQHSFNGMDIACFVCKKSFESPQEIQVHVLEHSSSYRKHACSKCPQKFFFSAELENHKLTYGHYGEAAGTAESTNSSSCSSPPSSNFHASALLASLSTSPLSMTDLSQSAALQLSKLHSHSQSSNNSTAKDLSSSSLNKKRLSSPSLLSSSSSSKAMKLDNASKKRGGAEALTIPSPSSSPSSSRRLECVDCHRLFTTGTALANHRKTHLRKEPKNAVKCSLCDEGFPSVTAMQQHFFSTHSISVRREEDKKSTFECMLCEKTCSTLSALQNHILSHRTRSLGLQRTEERIKEDSFTSPSQVEVCSEKNDTEEDEVGDSDSFDTSLLACPVCNQVFLNAEDIDDHIKTHEELFTTESSEPDGNSEFVSAKQELDDQTAVVGDVATESGK